MNPGRKRTTRKRIKSGGTKMGYKMGSDVPIETVRMNSKPTPAISTAFGIDSKNVCGVNCLEFTPFEGLDTGVILVPFGCGPLLEDAAKTINKFLRTYLI